MISRPEKWCSFILLFLGYSPAPPTCFILCGNFSSAPYGKNQVQALKGIEDLFNKCSYIYIN